MFDYEDLRQKLLVAGFDETHPIAISVLDLAVTLDNEQLSEYNRKTVFSLFSDFGMQQLDNIPQNILDQTEWLDFDYGNAKVGDYVRVKPNAYDAETGLKHNGRLGKLIYMYSRRCTVLYVGDRVTSSMVHPMTNLETIKRVYNR